MSKIDTVKKHKWAAMGVSGYPLSHPIVGQTRFYQQFRQFIYLVDDEAEKFAHVFAIVAQWGIGKSRLAYELTASNAVVQFPLRELMRAYKKAARLVVSRAALDDGSDGFER